MDKLVELLGKLIYLIEPFFMLIDTIFFFSFVDEKLKTSRRFKYDKVMENHPLAAEKLKFWTPELCALHPKSFDFIITV
jgi:hypothetical protein